MCTGELWFPFLYRKPFKRSQKNPEDTALPDERLQRGATEGAQGGHTTSLAQLQEASCTMSSVGYERQQSARCVCVHGCRGASFPRAVSGCRRGG